jgi:ribonucleoside-triphosphate reductase
MSEISIYQSFIAKSRYARFLPEKKRREHFAETTQRYVDFMFNHIAEEHAIHSVDDLKQELFTSILEMEVMPSMRAMMTAGKALARDNTCAYNCSYLPIDDQKAFDEAMLILMCGSGVGFSVERQYVNQLPEVPDHLYDSDTTIVVKDSKEGFILVKFQEGTYRNYEKQEQFLRHLVVELQGQHRLMICLDL